MTTTNKALINLDRRVELNYNLVRGDTWAPLPVTFKINGVAEDFSGSTLKMQIRKNGTLIKELVGGDGINVSGGSLQYNISAAAMVNWISGIYKYDVQKTTAGIVVTIQYGILNLVGDETV